MNEAQVEAVANADAHTSNAGLPTYSELLEMVKECEVILTGEGGHEGGVFLDEIRAALVKAA